MRTCVDCGQEFPLESFHVAGINKTGAVRRKRACGPCCTARKRANPNYSVSRRRHRLKGKYGITLDDYKTMMEAQGGVCAICQEGCGSTVPLAVLFWQPLRWQNRTVHGTLLT